MDKTWIGKRCKITAEGLNDKNISERLYYTALVIDIDDSHITFKDKFNKTVTLNLNTILKIDEIENA